MLSFRSSKRFVKTLLGRDLFLKPQVKVPTEFHGVKHAGFEICPIGLNPKSVIYSVGVGDNVSFDLSLIEKYGAQIYAFDPTPRCLAWIGTQSLPAQFVFSPVGLDAKDGEVTFFAPPESDHVSFSAVANRGGSAVSCQVRSLKTLAKERQHTKIDILKIDIEGSEYAVIPDVLSSGIEIEQILVEFHHRTIKGGASKTQQALDLLNQHGYLLFAVSDSGEELSFIHRNKVPKNLE